MRGPAVTTTRTQVAGHSVGFTAGDSLRAARSVHDELSKSPPGTSSYEAESPTPRTAG